MTRFAVHGVLNPILILVGAPTNIISCLVFYKQGLRDRMNLCLFVLALVDACYILSYVTACVRSYVRFWDEDLEQELMGIPCSDDDDDDDDDDNDGDDDDHHHDDDDDGDDGDDDHNGGCGVFYRVAVAAVADDDCGDNDYDDDDDDNDDYDMTTMLISAQQSVVYISFVTFAMRAASGCITMVVAVERCVCVVFPLRANSIMRTRTMGALLTAIVIALTLAFSIINLRNRVAEVRDEESGKAHHQILVTDFFSKHPLIYEILFNLILSIVVPIVTFVVVGVATAITVIKLRTAIAWRASTSSGRGDNRSQQQQAALTKMLVILSCVFMVFSTPGDINDTCTSVQEEPPFLPWDNPDNLMTLEQLEMTTIITNCVLSPILLLVGAPTNIISCLVFYKQGLRDRMNLCLFVLALVDTGYLVSVFVIGIHSFIGLLDEGVV
nr:hypothetical protein BaRGS_002774 [Batillaria attramentaria]